MTGESRPARATIITDASLCHDTKAAGWAAWCKSDTSSVSQTWSGVLKASPANSGEAELFAIANGLHVAAKSGALNGVAEVMLQSDATNALGWIVRLVPCATISAHKNSAPLSIPGAKPSENISAAIATIQAIVTKLNLKLTCRHVRGHTAGNGRQWVNRKCDELAKAAMKSERAVREAALG